jgi:SPP1 gp7 family putative phage head morphogenesis protein
MTKVAAPFRIPPWRRALIKRQFRRRDAVANEAVNAVEGALARATYAVFNQLVSGADFRAPDLSVLDVMGETFYRKLVEEAARSVGDERKSAEGKRRLAKGKPGSFVNSLPSLEKFFRGPMWRKTMVRSRQSVESMRKDYLARLRKRFREVAPRLAAGEISVADAKAKLSESWQASRGRVQTIFRTETTRYFTDVQVKFYEDDDGIIGFLFDSIADTGRTDWCRSRHGLVYRPGSDLLRRNSPPCHWNCRSHLIALASTPENRKMLADPHRDPSKRSVKPLPPGWTK